jgi:Cu(I)/Ag(I) efflux system membrane protein CusA/SilA
MAGGNGVPAPAPQRADGPALDWSPVDTGALDGLSGATRRSRRTFVPLGAVAELRVTPGPPMLRDEGGLLAGYVYVDVDPAQRDLGGYVAEAQQVVREALESGRLAMPPGQLLRWTGQYEQLEQMRDRMRIVIPATVLVVVVLLLLHFRNITEVLIVLLSVPFALVGSVWTLWLLDYRLSTAVWVGIIALLGLAAQTGIVMILYIDQAYERRRQAGRIRGLQDIVWAHMEGTVQRVRPKLMTVATVLTGLLPLLWATGSGADVMKRIAAPMVGGLVTSAFLTLEVIPVVYTYWRQEQLLWERLAPLDARRLRQLKLLARVQWAGWVLLAVTGTASIYVDVARALLLGALATGAALVVTGAAAYLRVRPHAHDVVWPPAAIRHRAAA